MLPIISKFFCLFLCVSLRPLTWNNFWFTRRRREDKREFGLLGEDKALSALSPESKVDIMGKYGRVTVIAVIDASELKGVN
jgi:hypothetical protein